MALSNKRKYPMVEFKSFVAAAKRYIAALGKDPLIHREVVSAISGLWEFLEIERKRVPGEVLYEADRSTELSSSCVAYCLKQPFKQAYPAV
jgi:hypothetical protein